MLYSKEISILLENVKYNNKYQLVPNIAIKNKKMIYPNN